MLEHFIRNDAFMKTIIVRKIEGKRRRGRPKNKYWYQINENVGILSYQGIKEKTSL